MSAKFTSFLLAVLAVFSLECCQTGQGENGIPGGNNQTPNDPDTEKAKDDIVSDTDMPPLQGLMVFHNYSSYDAMDSKLFLYDFKEDRLREISHSWKSVTHPMNGHISPDAKHITFMGIGSASGSWDIFIYEIGAAGEPKNLTPTGNFRDEDPKYSYDGTKIVFKRNDVLMEILLGDGSLHTISTGSAQFSMPYYSVDGKSVLYCGSIGSETYIACWDMLRSSSRLLYDKKGVTEYYPVTIDADSFYYTQHYSASDPHDQLYKGWFDGRESVSLPFNRRSDDYSDAGTISDGWLLLSSTRYDSRGGYDLYVANEKSGAIYSLSNYNININTGLNELGASYMAK